MIRRTIELQDFFAILPAFKSVYREIEYGYDGLIADRVDRPYNSRIESQMAPADLATYLRSHRILDAEDLCAS